MNNNPQRLTNPSITKKIFHKLFFGTFSSWGRTSKKVMYIKVPPAIPKIQDILKVYFSKNFYLVKSHYKYHVIDLEAFHTFQCRYLFQWDWRGWRQHLTRWSSWGWGRTGRCWGQGWRPSRLCATWQRWKLRVDCPPLPVTQLQYLHKIIW